MEDRNDSWTHTVQLDGENDCETQMEEQAVALAVATGACDRCCWLPTCCTRDDFAPPSDAWVHGQESGTDQGEIQKRIASHNMLDLRKDISGRSDYTHPLPAVLPQMQAGNNYQRNRAECGCFK